MRSGGMELVEQLEAGGYGTLRSGTTQTPAGAAGDAAGAPPPGSRPGEPPVGGPE